MTKVSPLPLVLCLALLSSCSAPPDTGSAQFAVSVSQALSTSVSRVSVTASAADFPPVSVDLSSSGGVWGGLLGNLPAGTNRSFLARAFDASGTELFEGSASGITLATHQTALVALTLQQLNAPPPFQNAAPLIDSLAASSTSVAAGATLSLTATAHDPNPDDTLSYAWSSTAGSFSSASAASTAWAAPSSAGPQTLTLTVTDAKGLSSSLVLTINVVPSPALGNAQVSITFNTTPQVTSVSATGASLAVGQSMPVSVSASDADGDSLSYAWSASCAGSWDQATSSTARFTPSALPAGSCNNCDLTVSVSDGRGGQTTGTLSLCVGTSSAYNHLNPIIGTTYRSSDTASAGQVLTYSVEASDPEGSALSFSWSANTGSSGTPATTASSSHLIWTAPACVRTGLSPQITATVTNAFHLTATQGFSVTGLPVCPPSSWASTGAMTTPRTGHTATLLPNGKVLVVGGDTASGYTATAEVYDPASGSWSAVASMSAPRSALTTVLLPDGKVCVMGGGYSPEVYDPATNRWSATGSTASPSTGTQLNNGKLLVIGEGSSGPASAKVYDPVSGTWSMTGSMTTPRSMYAVTLLSDGRVLITGGLNNHGPTASVEVYDPASGTWSFAGALLAARLGHTAIRMSDGKVLITGGYAVGSGNTGGAEVYDPISGTFSTTGSMATPHQGHMLTLLPDGRVLALGGYNNNTSTPAGAEVYDPAWGTWSAAGLMATPRQGHTATLLQNGKVLVTGGSGSSGYLSTVELFTP